MLELEPWDQVYPGRIDDGVFEAIVVNADRFRSLWGIWPMQGWLNAFSRLGLVVFDGDRLERLRAPTPDEILAARKPDARF